MMAPARSDRMRLSRTVRVWSSMCTDSHSPRRANRVGYRAQKGMQKGWLESLVYYYCSRIAKVFLNAAGKKRAYDTIGRHGGRVEIEGRELIICGGLYKEFRCRRR